MRGFILLRCSWTTSGTLPSAFQTTGFGSVRSKTRAAARSRLFRRLFPFFLLTCKHVACKYENEWVWEISCHWLLSRSLSLSSARALSLSVSPESSASERSGCKNQSGAMRQAAPQLANHRFEHQKRGGAVRLPATLSKQPSSHAATLLSSTSPPLPAARSRSHFCAPSAECAPQLQPSPVRFPADDSLPLVVRYFWISRRGAVTRGCSTFDGKQEVGRLLTLKVRSQSVTVSPQSCCGSARGVCVCYKSCLFIAWLVK